MSKEHRWSCHRRGPRRRRAAAGARRDYAGGCREGGCRGNHLREHGEAQWHPAHAGLAHFALRQEGAIYENQLPERTDREYSVQRVYCIEMGRNTPPATVALVSKHHITGLSVPFALCVLQSARAPAHTEQDTAVAPSTRTHSRPTGTLAQETAGNQKARARAFRANWCRCWEADCAPGRLMMFITIIAGD